MLEISIREKYKKKIPGAGPIAQAPFDTALIPVAIENMYKKIFKP